MESVIIGVDLGGTMVRVGAFDRRGALQQVREAPIEAARGPKVGTERIQGLIHEVLEGIGRAKLEGIGLGATGPVDPIRGIINNPYTLPTWEEVPIVTWLSEHFDVPVTLENDADVAALGEYWQGAGANAHRLYAITVGTGIGTALILDGQIYRGVEGAHPDGGHQVIDPRGPACYCGAHGCWESLASGSAIRQRAQELLVTHPESCLHEWVQGDLKRVDAQMVAKAAMQGDELASQVMERAAYYFSLGLVNVITLFVPEVIVIGGGVWRDAHLFMPAIQQAIQTHNIMVPASKVSILSARLGNYAGIYGAAYAIIQKLEGKDSNQTQ